MFTDLPLTALTRQLLQAPPVLGQNPNTDRPVITSITYYSTTINVVSPTNLHKLRAPVCIKRHYGALL